MHLAIDLRFYKPQPYGLSVYIDGLFSKLTPLLNSDETFSKITLILHGSNQNIDLNDYLNWWPIVEKNSKFQILYSASDFYKLSEQTTLLNEINDIKPDLVYFFTFNYPIFYKGAFVYQVLDLTQIKQEEFEKVSIQWKIKVWLMKLILKTGFKNSKYNIFLGSQTLLDSENYLGLNFSDNTKSDFKKSKVILSGINSDYLKENLAVSNKESLFLQNSSRITFDYRESLKLNILKEKLKIAKPYFLFISVWKKHKNIDRLVDAFSLFQKKNGSKYQLVLAGSLDPKYPELMAKISEIEEFKKGNIILAQKLPNESLIHLHDGAKAYIMPSLSEGFGMTLIEASARMNPVICSNLFIFKEILGKYGIYFDPFSVESIAESMQKFVNLSEEQVNQIQEGLYKNISRFTWDNVATDVLSALKEAK